MDHEHAVRELAAERYLLGELTGDARETFEAHIFECTRCAAEVTSSVRMAEAMRTELTTQPVERSPAQGRFAWVRRCLQPVWLAPALAACLLVLVLVLVYQNTVQLPRWKQQAAQASAPEVLSSLVLAAGASRGVEVPRIVVAPSQSFLLSVDIPPGNAPVNGSYTCTLFAPSGKAVWSGTISSEQARDAVLIRVPPGVTTAGEHTLLIRAGDAVVAKMLFAVELRG